MVISVACPACRRPLQFPDDAGGRVAACHCGQQMMLPVTPMAAPTARAAAPRAASSAPPRSRAATPAPRRPPGGSGAAPIVLSILLLLGVVAAFVFIKRGKALEFAKKKEEESLARREEQAKADAAEKMYVLLRVSIDDSVLPPANRNVVEGPVQYIGLRVEIVNHGYAAVTIDPVYFTLTADGARYGRDSAVAEKFEAMQLKDGEKVVVPLAYEVPDMHKPVIVEFKPASPDKCNVRYGDAR